MKSAIVVVALGLKVQLRRGFRVFDRKWFQSAPCWAVLSKFACDLSNAVFFCHLCTPQISAHLREILLRGIAEKTLWFKVNKLLEYQERVDRISVVICLYT